MLGIGFNYEVNITILILIILVACGKTEEGFLKNDLTDSERQYLLNQRRDKCLNDDQVKRTLRYYQQKVQIHFQSYLKL